MIISREYIAALKQEKKMPFPFLVQLEITDVCPFHCPQCYKGLKRGSHMDFDKLKDFVGYCYDNGTRFFVLNGGEPLLYYKIVDLLSYMNTFDVYMNCFTSGYGLTEEVIKLWNFDKQRLCLSLNGSTEEINNKTRQGYAVTIEAMHKLSLLDKRYGINWVARHDNVLDIENMLHLCESYSVGYLFITSEKLTGDGNLMSPLTCDDYDFLAKVIDSYVGDVEIIVESCFPTLNAILRKGNKKNYFMGCFAGRYGCHVNMKFAYSPCTHLPYYEEYATLKEYWDNSHYIRQLNIPDSNTHCKRCANYSICSPCYAWDVKMYQKLSREYINCPIFERFVEVM